MKKEFSLSKDGKYYSRALPRTTQNEPAKNDEMDDHFKDQFVPKTEESVPNIKDQFVPKQKSVSNNIIPKTITIEYISSGIID